MGSYAQFHATSSRGVVRRFTWVCGSESVLAQEVVDTIRRLIQPMTVMTFEMGLDSETWMWDACSSAPLGSRLVIVRQAESAKDWSILPHLIEAGRQLGDSWIVFVSAMSDYPKREDGSLQDHIAQLRDTSSGQLVRCSKPSEPDQLAWVSRLLPGAGKVIASYILARAGGDLQAVRDLCAKAALFGPEPSEALVDALLTEQAAEDFADSLTHLRRVHALSCAGGMTERDMAMAFGLLESRLSLMSVLAPAVRQQMTEHDMRGRLSISTVLIKRFKQVAPKYDDSRIHRCRQLLVLAESAWREGAREGVAEALVALW